MGFDAKLISKLTNVSLRTVQRYIRRYREWICINSIELFGDQRGHPRIITNENNVICIDQRTHIILDEAALEMSTIMEKQYDRKFEILKKIRNNQTSMEYVHIFS